jgi:histidine ammonia-lyase
MGTIASRDCLRILELTEQVVSASLLCGVQGVKCRLTIAPQNPPTKGLELFVEEISKDFKNLVHDRPLDQELRHFCHLIRTEQWSLYREF